jgi:hypothetical protein
MKPKVQIFLSYAREDFERVSEFYDRLYYAGFKPWMDKKDILPGERWEHSLWKALHDSDFILVCLSKNSVNKRGFLQRELREALDKWKEKLEDDIYLIPIRFEDCEVPESLREFEWVNLYENNGWMLLLKAIYKGIERLGKYDGFQAAYGDIKIRTERLIESKEIGLKYNLDVEFPQIEGLPDQSVRELNVILEGTLLKRVHAFRAIYGDEQLLDEWLSQFTSELNALYEVTLLTDNLVSLKMDFYEYGAGAAHGNSSTITFNYQLKPVFPIDLHILFRPNIPPNYLEIISEYCLNDLKRQAKQDDKEGDGESWIYEEGLSPNYENFEKFNITEHSLVFTFDPYQVSGYAWGTRLVEIPYSKIREYLNISSPLKPFLH